MNAQQVYVSCNPAIVEVNTYLNGSYDGHGSGVAYKTSKGITFILTAKHVIKGDTSEQVIDSKGKSYNVVETWSSTISDIAVLKVKGWHGKTLPFGFETPTVGTPVYNIGFPLSYEANFLSKGYVSSSKKLIFGELMVTTCMDSFAGGSGSPLLDAKGYIIGLFTAGSSEEHRICFSLPIKTVKKALVTLKWSKTSNYAVQ